MPLYQKSGYTLLSTLSTSSGASWTTPILPECWQFFIEGVGVSLTGNTPLRLKLGNGALLGTAVNVTGILNAASAYNFSFGLAHMSGNLVTVDVSLGDPRSGNALSQQTIVSTTANIVYNVPPFINIIGFDIASGAGDAGTIRVYGIPK